MAATQKRTAKKTSVSKAKSYEGFTEEERDAMKERAKELKTSGRGAKADPEAEVLEKIAELSDSDRVIAEGIHAIVKASAPQLTSKTWYGMPGWAKDGKVLCFFQGAHKFKTRYPTFGFNDNASLDDGTMWPVAYAITEFNEANKKLITTLVKRAAG